MTNSNTYPSNKPGHAADIDKPVIGLAFTDKRGEEGGETEDSRSKESVGRYAAFVEL